METTIYSKIQTLLDNISFTVYSMQFETSFRLIICDSFKMWCCSLNMFYNQSPIWQLETYTYARHFINTNILSTETINFKQQVYVTLVYIVLPSHDKTKVLFVHRLTLSIDINYNKKFPLLTGVLYTNIDQTLVNSLHRLLNCELGGLDCHVIITEYRTRGYCIHMLHLFCNALVQVFFGSILSLFSYNTSNTYLTSLLHLLRHRMLPRTAGISVSQGYSSHW